MSRRSRMVIGWGLLLVGVIALVKHQHRFERMDGWGWLSLLTLAAAPLIGFAGRTGLSLLLASIPFWLYGNASEPILVTAVGLVIGCLVVVAVRPTLPGRSVRRSGATPLPQLATGPLAPVVPRTFFAGHQNRFLRDASMAFAVAALLLFALSMAGYDYALSVGLGVSAVIVSTTLAFANWFATRVRLRIDAAGVHGRTMLREHTARWTDISGLRLRYVFLPGYSIRLVYYVVETPSTEVAFPSSMRGAKELQAAIEAATGLRWPEPDVTPTM